MKVLIVSGYSPFEIGSGPGGCLYHLSKALATIGCEVHILAPKYTIERDLGRGVTLHYYNNPIKNNLFGKSWLSFSFFSIPQIRHLCSSYGIEIVHGHSPTTFAYSCLRDQKVPFVVSAHGASFSEMSSFFRTPIKYLTFSSMLDGIAIQPTWAYLTNFEYQYADKVHAVSKAVAYELIRYNHIDSERIHVIPNGVNPVSSNNPIEENLILSVGRMVWRKGFVYLINAMPSVLEDFPDAKLMIIGQGTYKQKLIEQIKILNLQNSVILHECMPQEELFKIYLKAHVYVQPSLYEPLGNTVLEAMASGKAIIATNVGGIPEMISHQNNGLLVAPYNSLQLASNIKLLLSDTNYAQKIGRNARATACNFFSWGCIAQKTLDFYNDSLGSYR